MAPYIYDHIWTSQIGQGFGHEFGPRAPFDTQLKLDVFLYLATGFQYFMSIEGTIFRSRWPLLGPPWPFPGLPSLQFNSLDLQESGLDPTKLNFDQNWKVVARFGRICQKMKFFETPLKRCASTRAFEPYQFRVIWRSWSKVMAKILSTCRVTKSVIIAIAIAILAKKSAFIANRESRLDISRSRNP